jgi:hypothetical protein
LHSVESKVSAKTKPIHKLRFRLTREDFAAFERLPEELTGWDRLYFLGPAVVAGMLYGIYGEAAKRALPFEIGDSVWWFAAMAGLVAFAYAAMVLLLTLRYFRRVKRARVPQTETLLETFEDRFRIRQDGARAHSVPMESAVRSSLLDLSHFPRRTGGHFVGKCSSREIDWSNVTVIPAKAHVFLCPAPRAPIIVPRRAFASEQEMQAFARFAEAAGRESENEPNEKDDAHVA